MKYKSPEVKYCPSCSDNGKYTELKLFQINLSQAVFLCSDRSCTYPSRYKWIIENRSLDDLLSSDSESEPEDCGETPSSDCNQSHCLANSNDLDVILTRTTANEKEVVNDLIEELGLGLDQSGCSAEAVPCASLRYPSTNENQDNHQLLFDVDNFLIDFDKTISSKKVFDEITNHSLNTSSSTANLPIAKVDTNSTVKATVIEDNPAGIHDTENNDLRTGIIKIVSEIIVPKDKTYFVECKDNFTTKNFTVLCRKGGLLRVKEAYETKNNPPEPTGVLIKDVEIEPPINEIMVECGDVIKNIPIDEIPIIFDNSESLNDLVVHERHEVASGKNAEEVTFNFSENVKGLVPKTVLKTFKDIIKQCPMGDDAKYEIRVYKHSSDLPKYIQKSMFQQNVKTQTYLPSQATTSLTGHEDPKINSPPVSSKLASVNTDRKNCVNKLKSPKIPIYDEGNADLAKSDTNVMAQNEENIVNIVDKVHTILPCDRVDNAPRKENRRKKKLTAWALAEQKRQNIKSPAIDILRRVKALRTPRVKKTPIPLGQFKSDDNSLEINVHKISEADKFQAFNF